MSTFKMCIRILREVERKCDVNRIEGKFLHVVDLEECTQISLLCCRREGKETWMLSPVVA